MAYNKSERDQTVQPVVEVVRTYEVKKALFGLLTYRQLVDEKEVDNWLDIQTEIPPNKIRLNGKLLNPTQIV